MKMNPQRIIFLLAYLTFLIFGMFQAGIGPVLEELSVQTSSSLSIIGGVLTFLFLGSLISQMAAGSLIDRFGAKKILIISLFCLGTGIWGFTQAQQIFWMFLLVFCTGIGQGGVDLATNLVITEVYPTNNASALNLLHFFFGLGAFISPAFIGLAINQNGSGLFIHWILAGLFILLSFGYIGMTRQSITDSAGSEHPISPRKVGHKIYLSPLLWVLGIVFLIFVGVEYGLGSWITNYMKISTGMTLSKGAGITSVYWGALALGRLVASAVSRKLSGLKLLMIALLSSLLGAMGLYFSYSMIIPTIVCLVWISFSYATIIPTTVAMTTEAFPQHKGKAVGFLSVMGGVGGAILPWLAGFLLERSANFGYLLFVIGSILLLLFLVLLIQQLSKPAFDSDAA
jgi:fucose permease